jgi:hypothetical protein
MRIHSKFLVLAALGGTLIFSKPVPADSYADNTTGVFSGTVGGSTASGNAPQQNGWSTTGTFSGTVGNTTGKAPPPVAPAAPASPTVMDILKTPVKPTAAVPPAITTTSPGKPEEKDPCGDYKSLYEAYVICQDRMKKIQRMIDAQKERDRSLEPPPPPPPPPGAPAGAWTPPPGAVTPASNTPASAAPTDASAKK